MFFIWWKRNFFINYLSWFIKLKLTLKKMRFALQILISDFNLIYSQFIGQIFILIQRLTFFLSKIIFSLKYKAVHRILKSAFLYTVIIIFLVFLQAFGNRLIGSRWILRQRWALNYLLNVDFDVFLISKILVHVLNRRV